MCDLTILTDKQPDFMVSYDFAEQVGTVSSLQFEQRQASRQALLLA